jgi:hypothetical protein
MAEPTALSTRWRPWVKALLAMSVLSLAVNASVHVAVCFGHPPAWEAQVWLSGVTTFVAAVGMLLAVRRLPNGGRGFWLWHLDVPRWLRVGFIGLALYAVVQVFLVDHLYRPATPASAPCLATKPCGCDQQPARRVAPGVAAAPMAGFLLPVSAMAALMVLHALRFRPQPPRPRDPMRSATAALPMADPNLRLPSSFPLALSGQLEMGHTCSAPSLVDYLDALVTVLQEEGFVLARTGGNAIGTVSQFFSGKGLRGTGAGEIVLEQTGGDFVARYRFDLRPLLLSTLAGVIFMVAVTLSKVASWWPAGAFAVMVAWVYGANYVTARSRILQPLRKASQLASTVRTLS